MYSVPNKAMAEEMLARGYVQLKHRPIAEWGDLPSGAAPAAAVDGAPAEEPRAPVTFRMPQRVPDVRGKESASQIVRMFERVAILVTDKGAGEMREEFYSPLRLWTA
eukprot:1436607-Prymnesium_polylepis.1